MFLNDENDDETKLLELDYNTPLPARSASERQNYAILKAYAKVRLLHHVCCFNANSLL